MFEAVIFRSIPKAGRERDDSRLIGSRHATGQLAPVFNRFKKRAAMYLMMKEDVEYIGNPHTPKAVCPPQPSRTSPRTRLFLAELNMK